jgi:hypothetical protein
MDRFPYKPDNQSSSNYGNGVTRPRKKLPLAALPITVSRHN